ncbi:MAG: kelch repeat-containing protein [Anaerolineales bacterium]|jgi:DNA-binding CsgD family transcriptional regulator/N-acetylneuraminic acid mutarotase
MSLSTELSDREREILRLVATGASNKEIAQELHISPNTVKVHLRSVFGKIGVASRTEATLYAIRAGLASTSAASEAPDQAFQMGKGPLAPPAQALPAVTSPPEGAGPLAQRGLLQRRRAVLLLAGSGTLVLVLAVVGASLARARTAPVPAPTPAPFATPQRWSQQAPLPTARSGFGALARGRLVYVFGGQGSSGPIASVDRYDATSDSWAELPPMLQAASDVKAVLVEGQVFVPGGRLGSGAVSDRLQVFDLERNQWQEGARLPQALSAYALVESEGKLYLFGGWNGQEYVATTYSYDPARDTWSQGTPLPSPRGYAGAAVAGGGLYVIGGLSVQGPLDETLEYFPEREASGGSPWETNAPLPGSRYDMGVAEIAGRIYVMGGRGTPGSLPFLEYSPERDSWQSFQGPVPIGSGVALVPLETYLYALGGQLGGKPSAANLAYQAIYAVILPLTR